MDDVWLLFLSVMTEAEISLSEFSADTCLFLSEVCSLFSQELSNDDVPKLKGNNEKILSPTLFCVYFLFFVFSEKNWWISVAMNCSMLHM